MAGLRQLDGDVLCCGLLYLLCSFVDISGSAGHVFYETRWFWPTALPAIAHTPLPWELRFHARGQLGLVPWLTDAPFALVMWPFSLFFI